MKVMFVRVAIGLPDDADDKDIARLLANIFENAEPVHFIQSHSIEPAVIVTEREWEHR